MRFIWLSLIALAALGCGSKDGGGGGDGEPDGGVVPCEGIGCKVVTCPNGGTTSISGTVFAPNGTLPIYGATVYIPLSPVDPIVHGVSCDRCADLSGNPLVRATTDENGKFLLTNVPATTDVPVVIQVGKWRRQITVPAIPQCVDTPLVDTNITRLPKNKTEGDIPKMALATGGADALECLLRKVGLEDSEFSTSAGNGSVHLFAGRGGSPRFDASLGSGSFPIASQALWNNEAALSAYDVVFLSCEGTQDGNAKSLASRAAMKSYADKGGRVFASHWHNIWLQGGPAPWNQALTWQPQTDLGNNIDADIDTTFPKSTALTNWLRNVGALTNGRLRMNGVQHTATAVNPMYAERWIHLAQTSNGTPSVQYASMITPIEETDQYKKCGRVVYSDIHVSADAPPDPPPPPKPFPGEQCAGDVRTLTAQEKVLAFMIFDIASCVGDPIE